MSEEAFISKLKEALEECYQIKEHFISECDFDNAARYRDYGDVLKKLIANATGVDKLMLLQKAKVPLNQCRHLRLNQSKSKWDFKEALDVRQILDLEAQDMGYQDYEDLELAIIREVGECGANCVWWNWRKEIIKKREERGKSLTERQPDWKPEDLVIPANIKEILKEREERRNK